MNTRFKYVVSAVLAWIAGSLLAVTMWGWLWAALVGTIFFLAALFTTWYNLRKIQNPENTPRIPLYGSRLFGGLSAILAIVLVMSTFLWAGGEVFAYLDSDSPVDETVIVDAGCPNVTLPTLEVVNLEHLQQFLGDNDVLYTCNNGVMQEFTPNDLEMQSTLEPLNQLPRNSAGFHAAMASPESEVVQGNWDIHYYSGATDQIQEWIFQDVAPDLWQTFPNVPNLSYPDFLVTEGDQVPHGLEFGMQESAYCQQHETCDIIVPARHYRIITGDYNIPGVGSCTGSESGLGCAIMLVNVGEVSSNFEDAHVDAGWTVFGRYWHGDWLWEAIWGALSHVTANMLNMPTSINPSGSVNAGANCSVPNGCETVDDTFVILSGNEVLMTGNQQYSLP